MLFSSEVKSHLLNCRGRNAVTK